MSRFGNPGVRLVKRILLASTVIFLSAGISAVAADVEDPRVVVSDRIAQAEASLLEAAALGHAWTVTQPLIDDAVAALQAGDIVLAGELAERALATARASIAQANLEEKTWRSRVPQ